MLCDVLHVTWCVSRFTCHIVDVARSGPARSLLLYRLLQPLPLTTVPVRAAFALPSRCVSGATQAPMHESCLTNAPRCPPVQAAQPAKPAHSAQPATRFRPDDGPDEIRSRCPRHRRSSARPTGLARPATQPGLIHAFEKCRGPCQRSIAERLQRRAVVNDAQRLGFVDEFDVAPIHLMPVQIQRIGELGCRPARRQRMRRRETGSRRDASADAIRRGRSALRTRWPMRSACRATAARFGDPAGNRELGPCFPGNGRCFGLHPGTGATASEDESAFGNRALHASYGYFYRDV